MIVVRKSDERGYSEIDWLKSYHTFSFADYRDMNHMGFRTLRVINEDWVAPDRGFGTHPHRDMEIITYVISGAVEHRDSMGTGSVIRPGEVQKMSAGTGVTHSEINPSVDDELHLLQIWILPKIKGIKPSYEQKAFTNADKANRFCLVASADGADGSIKINQDAKMYASLISKGSKVVHSLKEGRYGWLQIVSGEVEVGSYKLAQGDGAAFSDEREITLLSHAASEILFFDLS